MDLKIFSELLSSIREDLVIYLLLLLGGVLSGFINTLAGGGSILILPILITFAGLSPEIANGTNRVGILLQSWFGFQGFKSKGISDYPHSLHLGLVAMVGAVLGAWLSLDIDAKVFMKLLSVIIILSFFFLFYKPKESKDAPVRMSATHRYLSYGAFLLIGFYGGFIQVGVGFLIMLALAAIHNLPTPRVNAIKMLVVGIYTIPAFIVFAGADKIHYGYGVTAAIGSALGAWVTSRWSVKANPLYVKIILGVMLIIFAVRLWFYS